MPWAGSSFVELVRFVCAAAIMLAQSAEGMPINQNSASYA
jgi:hypothetical protein